MSSNKEMLIDYFNGTGIQDDAREYSVPIGPRRNASHGYEFMPDDYGHTYSTVHIILYTLIFLCGMIGNIMVVYVVTWSKNMRTATNCYLLSLAVADCIILMAATLPAIPEPMFRVKEWPWGRVMCSIIVYLQYQGINASTLSISAFTVERYIAICHPMRAQVTCSVARAKRIIAVMWVISVIYCAPWIGLTTTVQDTISNTTIEMCVFKHKRQQYLIYYLIDFVILYVTPLTMAAAMYSHIAYTLYKNMAFEPEISTDDVYTRASRASESVTSLNRRRRTRSTVQVIRMLVVVVVVFAVAWLPYRTLVVYNSLAPRPFMNAWFLLFCRCMIYLNSAINPILYSAMSVKFRRAFKRCLCCGNLAYTCMHMPLPVMRKAVDSSSTPKTSRGMISDSV